MSLEIAGFMAKPYPFSIPAYLILISALFLWSTVISCSYTFDMHHGCAWVAIMFLDYRDLKFYQVFLYQPYGFLARDRSQRFDFSIKACSNHFREISKHQQHIIMRCVGCTHVNLVVESSVKSQNSYIHE